MRSNSPLISISNPVKKPALFLGLGLAVLAALFVVLKPAAVPVAASSTTLAAASSVVASAPAAATPHAYEMAIEHGAKRSGPEVMQVTEGDEVTLTLRSDHADELHVHGYDLHAKVKADAPTVLNFKADRTGRFTMELHHSNVELGALEVLPR